MVTGIYFQPTFGINEAARKTYYLYYSQNNIEYTSYLKTNFDLTAQRTSKEVLVFSAIGDNALTDINELYAYK